MVATVGDCYQVMCRDWLLYFATPLQHPDRVKCIRIYVQRGRRKGGACGYSCANLRQCSALRKAGLKGLARGDGRCLCASCIARQANRPGTHRRRKSIWRVAKDIRRNATRDCIGEEADASANYCLPIPKW